MREGEKRGKGVYLILEICGELYEFLEAGEGCGGVGGAFSVRAFVVAKSNQDGLAQGRDEGLVLL